MKGYEYSVFKLSRFCAHCGAEMTQGRVFREYDRHNGGRNYYDTATCPKWRPPSIWGESRHSAEYRY